MISKMPKSEKVISLLSRLPWGSHVCLFYQKRDDLLDITVPVVEAGFGEKNFCMWVCTEQKAQSAIDILRPAIADFDSRIDAGDLEVVPCPSLFFGDGSLRITQALDALQTTLDRALASGRTGLRVVLDVASRDEKLGQTFAEFEKCLDNFVVDRRLLVLCAYPLQGVSVSTLQDVCGCHQGVVVQRCGHTQLLTGTQQKYLETEFAPLHLEAAENQQGSESLWRERDKLRAVIDNISVGVGIGVTDTHGTTLSLNAEGLRIHGFSSEEEMFANLEKYVKEFELRSVDGRVMPLEDWPTSRAMRGEYVQDYEVILIRPHIQQPLWVSYSVAPIYANHGQVELHVFTMVDMTERRRAEQALRKAREELEVCVQDRTLELQQSNVLLENEIIERQQAVEALLKSEASLKEAQQIAHIGNWEWNAKSDTIWWSDEYYRVFNFDRRIPPPNYSKHLQAYTPESAARLDSAAQLALQTGEKYELDLAIADPASPTRWICARGEGIRDAEGRIIGLRGTAQDITERKQVEDVNSARLYLMQYAAGHSLESLLQATLDEAEALSGSAVGFYHFVAEDQQTVLLQNWSTRTRETFSTIKGERIHDSLLGAGASWADCIRERRPVIHNDYQTLEHHSGLPKDHVLLVREMVVPVQRESVIKAILGLGNKPRDYTSQDVEMVALLADLAWDIVERKRAEESVRKLSKAVEQSPAAIVITDATGSIEFVNRQFTQITGYSPEEAEGQNPRLIFGETPNEDYERLWQTIRSGGVWRGEFQSRKKNGEVFWERATIAPIRNANNRITHCVAIKEDITENKHLEEQLLQAQKMESIGLLAGGVAHDYNNMLGVIAGYSELALEQVAEGEPLHDSLTEILRAARRSIDLTGKLLAFARKQIIRPMALDLNETVESMLKMLRRLIGEDIDLAWLPGSGLWTVYIDPSQIDQLLANLCVNARDAIGGVGRITIETRNITFDKPYFASHFNIKPGSYVLLAITDGGGGMDSDTLSHIFEPFYTTKGIGEGTGLGLATVYGIVKQNNGAIDVVSRTERGTTFRLYFPRYLNVSDTVGEQPPMTIHQGHGETILLVEDEMAILKMGQQMLVNLGYQVLAAGTPGEALQLAQAHADRIRLLITDVVMPEMNGKDLADRMHALYPELKILFISGYTSDVIAHRGVLDDGINFITKPFSQRDLAIKVYDAIGVESSE